MDAHCRHGLVPQLPAGMQPASVICHHEQVAGAAGARLVPGARCQTCPHHEPRAEGDPADALAADDLSQHGRFWQSLQPSCPYVGRRIDVLRPQSQCKAGGLIEVHQCRHPDLVQLDGSAPACLPRPWDVQRLREEHRRGDLRDCATCPQRRRPRWMSIRRMVDDVAALARRLPPEVTHIAGIARSGIWPATQVSMLLHRPLVIVRPHPQFRDVIDVGHGWRLEEGQPAERHTLAVIDSNVMTGHSISQYDRVMSQWARKQRFAKVITCAVYVNPLAERLPDLWQVHAPWPMFTEDVFFNSTFCPAGTGLDFDGILCRDCLPQEDDDGERYLNFLRTAAPKHLVRKQPIPMICTGRLEKYRAETLKWLDRHGVRCLDLRMVQRDRIQQRTYEDIVALKCRGYSDLRRRRPNIRFTQWMFVESDDRQARDIFRRAGGMVICPDAEQVYC